MSPYPQFDDALRRHAADLIGRGFRIAMVQLGWDAATGEKALLRTPPKNWQSTAPLTADQIQPAIDAGCNAYLYRLPDGWWVVDADTAELTAEYTGLLGPPDVVTPRGAHWVVDAPAKRLHKLDTGVRAFYGPSSFYPGGDGRLRAYVGVVPDRPRALPAQLRRTATEYGELAPGEAAVLEPGAARYTEARLRTAWLESTHGGRHFAMIEYLPQLARLLRAKGMSWEEVADQLMLAVQAHPEYDDGWFDDETGSAGGAVASALGYAVNGPWTLGVKPGFDERFVPPDPREAPAPADVGDGGELFAPGDDEFYDNPPPPPEPVYGSFGGKLPLFYDTGVHWLQGESESGKSWVGFEVVREVLSSGGWAFVVDHEDTRGSVLRRFKALGMTREEYRRLVYVSGPDVTHAELRAHLATTERDYAVMLVDGVTSALNAAGLSGRDEQELTRWVDQLPRQARMAICIDHVVKATDDRQGMAIGSQAKKSVVTGSGWEVVCTSPFGRGRDGRIELRPQKDKGGFLRGELGRTAVRLEFKSGDGGDRVRLEAGTAGEGFFADPDDALFAALFADGIDGGIGSNELAREAKQRGDPTQGGMPAQRDHQSGRPRSLGPTYPKQTQRIREAEMARLSKAKLAERRAAEWELYCRGWTMPQIAREYSLDVSTISDDLKVYREALPQQVREQMIERHHTTLADITRRLDELSRLDAPPVTAGTMGAPVIDPATGQWVRDYSGQITALRELRTTLAQEAKLAGLNAADKVEVSGAVTVEGSVDAEIRKLTEQLGIQDPAVLPASGAPAGLSEGVRGSDADVTA